ncbi:ABC transporter [Ceratobasidium sp. AG-Ba]|nr:ABC transporter [Ceratobasidium sp. AG-Ba]
MDHKDEETSPLPDHGYQSDSTTSGSPLLDEKSRYGVFKDEVTKQKDGGNQFHEVNAGAWTVYYLMSAPWTSRLPGLQAVQRARGVIYGLPIVWNFLLENLSLGPIMFLTYFLATTLSGLVTSAKLYNNMKMLELIEKPDENQALNREKFEQVVSRYLLAFMADWMVKKINARSGPILKQRVTLHFRTRLLAAHSRLDYPTSQDSVVEAKLKRAEGYSSSAWAILENVSTIISIAVEIVSQTSVMIQVLVSRKDSLLFFGICMARSLVSELTWSFEGKTFYARITNVNWLRMDALYDMGTQTQYKQDVLGDNLEDYVSTEFKKNLDALGDITGERPEIQWGSRTLFDLTDLEAALDVLPMITFAWSAVQGAHSSNLSSLMLIQQASSSLQSTVSRIWLSGGNLASVIANIISLCEAMEIKAGMPDGNMAYPEEKYANQKGMSIEFKSVGFSYPNKDRQVLNNMSFRIGAGQLCVIVGENGCGKSTTIGLISRIYDCTSGEILVDGRPLSEFKTSTVRDATCVMYQNYTHYPLPIGENIRIGRPDSANSQQEVESAAKMAGAYEFIQKLPEKFDTDLAYNFSGYPSHWYQGHEENPFQSLVDAQFKTHLSGGEWRRLALAKTYMRNSDRIKLLCYDEPSASLDPKAEFKTFEQIRSLRGQKTMIFITHRFGHLTKHADLILYMQEGTVVEQGTHKELMTLDGEYAKMYNLQSQAFSEAH